jgi:hypothetical protein
MLKVALPPLGDPARTITFAARTVVLPENHAQFGLDIDGDGQPGNRLGDLVGIFSAQGVNLQASLSQSLASGSAVPLLRVETQNQDLTMSQRADVTLALGAPAPPPLVDVFLVDPSVEPVTLPGMLIGQTFTSETSSADSAPWIVRSSLPLFAASNPLVFDVHAARLGFAIAADGSNLEDASLAGAVLHADVESVIAPGLAAELTAQIAANPHSPTAEQLQTLFDVGGCTKPDGTVAKAGDGVIDVCEVLNNPLVSAVFNPDVRLFDSNGAFAPGPGGKKDSLSVGFGFTASLASF